MNNDSMGARKREATEGLGSYVGAAVFLAFKTQFEGASLEGGRGLAALAACPTAPSRICRPRQLPLCPPLLLGSIPSPTKAPSSSILPPGFTWAPSLNSPLSPSLRSQRSAPQCGNKRSPTQKPSGSNVTHRLHCLPVLFSLPRIFSVIQSLFWIRSHFYNGAYFSE